MNKRSNVIVEKNDNNRYENESPCILQCESHACQKQRNDMNSKVLITVFESLDNTLVHDTNIAEQIKTIVGEKPNNSILKFSNQKKTIICQTFQIKK